MSEFGHTGTIIPGFGCVDSWGAGPFEITVPGKTYRCEDSDRFGPSLITKTGDIAAKQPGGRSPFWKGHRAWVKQGRRLSDDGVSCIFEPLRPTIVRRIRGREVEIVEEGDDDDNYVFVD